MSFTRMKISAPFLFKNKKVKPLAFAPDLICYMELDENKIKQSLSNADIQKNKEVALIGFKADEKLRDVLFWRFMQKHVKISQNL